MGGWSLPSQAELQSSKDRASAEDWRPKCLIDAGVSSRIALRLASSEGDLHKMLDAKGAGCTDKQLERIFG